jgi:transposase
VIRTLLREEQWERTAPLIPGKLGDPGRHGADNGFVEATLWIARTGSPWRDLPSQFGNWNTVFQRFRRWATKGIYETLFKTLSEISNTSWSTARSSGSINMEPAQKGDSKSAECQHAPVWSGLEWPSARLQSLINPKETRRPRRLSSKIHDISSALSPPDLAYATKPYQIHLGYRMAKR